MKKEFNKFDMCEAEIFLKENHYDYTKNKDGTITVHDTINLSNMDLTRLPNLQNVIVEWHFDCNDNLLISLEGAPLHVGGEFWCSDNKLTSLKGAPKSVGAGFYCDNNNLTSLKHAPSVFEFIQSDFGTFKSHNNIPKELLLSPQEKKIKKHIETGMPSKKEIKFKKARFKK